jgi:hypothetical protein
MSQPLHACRLAAAVTAAALIVAASALPGRAHDVTTRVTWNREISRIVYSRCATCHRPGSTAFSLLSYQEASPWAKAIKAGVLRRTMPPWGAVKGFGTFRNDQALLQEELDLIANWVDGGTPEGNPNDLPRRPTIPEATPDLSRSGEIVATGHFRFPRPFTIDGFWVTAAAAVTSARVTVAFPDGRIEPLVWLRDYASRHSHPFLLRKALGVPAGATIRGLPAGVGLRLLPLAPSR